MRQREKNHNFGFRSFSVKLFNDDSYNVASKIIQIWHLI